MASLDNPAAAAAAAAFNLFLFFSLSLVARPSAGTLVKERPLVLKYHNGTVLKGPITVNLVWYGKFTPVQRSIILDFLQSLGSIHAPSPSVAKWWKTTAKYDGGVSGSTAISVGKQVIDENCSLGKSLRDFQIRYLASKGGPGVRVGSVNVVLTGKDVSVSGFCMSRCGTHGSTAGKDRVAYAWVGNSETQCPGQCAWPFHQPIYGPQTPPLVSPNGDFAVDGMIINLATVLAGAVTNPFNNGYFQGPATAPTEAVSACTGMFGSGSYPGYPGQLLVDKTTGASYNAYGVNGRKFMLPAMWDPQVSACLTLV